MIIPFYAPNFVHAMIFITRDIYIYIYIFYIFSPSDAQITFGKCNIFVCSPSQHIFFSALI